MRLVECGIKAFDIHELLCHFIAKRNGYYRDAGLRVRVVDVTFTPDSELPKQNYFQVACGAAYMSRRSGEPFKVYLAATNKPMFYLCAGPEIKDIGDLRGKRIATHAPVAPPYWFNRIALRKNGLDPDGDVELWPARDDLIRLGLLRDDDVDAAVLSSAVCPVTVQEHGLNMITLLGDQFDFVTTGVATTDSVANDDPALLRELVQIFKKSLVDIQTREDMVVEIIAEVLNVPHSKAEKTFDLVKHCYTPDGRIDAREIQVSLETMDAELEGSHEVNAGTFYDRGYLD